MFVINYSKDILYLVLAFSVLWLTFFLTWLIYHLVAAARQLHKAANSLKEQVDHLSGIIAKIRGAFELPSSLIVLFFEGLKKLVSMGTEAMSSGRQKRAKARAEADKDDPEEMVL